MKNLLSTSRDIVTVMGFATAVRSTLNSSTSPLLIDATIRSLKKRRQWFSPALYASIVFWVLPYSDSNHFWNSPAASAKLLFSRCLTLKRRSRLRASRSFISMASAFFRFRAVALSPVETCTFLPSTWERRYQVPFLFSIGIFCVTFLLYLFLLIQPAI